MIDEEDIFSSFWLYMFILRYSTIEKVFRTTFWLLLSQNAEKWYF